MKQLSKAEVMKKSKLEHNRLVQLLQTLNEEELTMRGVISSPSPGQSCKDILAHLTAWEQRMMRNVRAILQGSLLPEYPKTSEYNAYVHTINKERSLSDIQADFENTYEEVITFIGELTENELATEGVWQLVGYNSYNHYKWAYTTILRWFRDRE